MLRLLIASLFIAIWLPCAAQTGPRTWGDHLSVNSCNSVTKLGRKIYASNHNSVVFFDEEELAPQRLNKINGLSDVEVRLVRANPHNKKLLVVYENTNIDLIDFSGAIANFPDFKLKTMSARKIINEVTFYNHLAYLACGFGIVLFDTDKLEIKETFFIGPEGGNLEVFQIAVNDSMLFAATARGMMTCNYKRKIPNNFRNWTTDTLDMPAGPHNGVLNVNGVVICCYSGFKKNSEQGKDTFYVFEPSTSRWKKYPPLAYHKLTILRLGPVQGDMFAYLDMNGAVFRKINGGELVNYVGTFNGQIDYGTVRDCYFGIDYSGNLSYWVADSRFGLHQTYGYFPYYPQKKITLNGMNRRNVGRIDLLEGIVVVSPSRIDQTGFSPYLREGLNIFENGEWRYLPVTSKDGSPALDVTSVIIDRKDKTRIWASSMNSGIYMFRNEKLERIYDSSNGLPILEGTSDTRSQGLAQDADGNIWFANSEQRNLLSVIRRAGNYNTYQNFQFDAPRFTRRVFVDRNNVVWMLHEREGGITVFKHNNFAQPVQGVNYKVLTNAVGNGNLQSNSVYAIAEDKDGKIWVGTKSGISVFYNPSAIFGSNFDSQPIKIVQDGNVELLLGNETVTSIVVDGANNKWVGTEFGGLYCFSPDGIRQIYHFTRENSPLFSNNIVELNYDETTGDVFIGTELGLQTFRSTIVAGFENFDGIYAFPNPVKPGYAGTVLVRGLIDNAIVKVTDTAGNLVWEARSYGGQIEWPMVNLLNSRVDTGVYLIYASKPDGTANAVTKVLVMN
jgi:hypothetical protein